MTRAEFGGSPTGPDERRETRRTETETSGRNRGLSGSREKRRNTGKNADGACCDGDGDQTRFVRREKIERCSCPRSKNSREPATVTRTARRAATRSRCDPNRNIPGRVLESAAAPSVRRFDVEMNAKKKKNQYSSGTTRVNGGGHETAFVDVCTDRFLIFHYAFVRFDWSKIGRHRQQLL